MKYRAHTVYVVDATYPTIAQTSAALREATAAEIADPEGPRLGVLSNGRCVSLSPYETRECGRKERAA